jgi:hypothetical protein
MKKENKGKDRNKSRKKEKANRDTKATADDIIKLKQHFDKKFGRS